MKEKKARNLIPLVIIIALLALFLRIFLSRLIKENIAQNDSFALDTLKVMATALENYADDHLGNFPEDFSNLTNASPPYIEEDYLKKSPLKGYIYSCPRLDSSGYQCMATPVKCNYTGKMVYTVTTAGVVNAEECAKRE